MNFNTISSDLQTLNISDLKRIGIAPITARVIVLSIVASIIIGSGIWFFVLPKNDELQAVKDKEMQLKIK